MLHIVYEMISLYICKDRNKSVKSTLQLLVSFGGSALPNLLVYYWAAILVNVR